MYNVKIKQLQKSTGKNVVDIPDKNILRPISL
jgi:hypothetical protein